MADTAASAGVSGTAASAGIDLILPHILQQTRHFHHACQKSPRSLLKKMSGEHAAEFPAAWNQNWRGHERHEQLRHGDDHRNGSLRTPQESYLGWDARLVKACPECRGLSAEKNKTHFLRQLDMIIHLCLRTGRDAQVEGEYLIFTVARCGR